MVQALGDDQGSVDHVEAGNQGDGVQKKVSQNSQKATWAEQETKYHQEFTSAGVRIRASLVTRWMRDHGPQRLDVVLEILKNPGKYLKNGLKNPTRFAIYAIEHWEMAGHDMADTKAVEDLAKTVAMLAGSNGQNHSNGQASRSNSGELAERFRAKYGKSSLARP